MKNDGKEAEKAFEAYWTRRGHLQRLRDARDLMALNGGQRVVDFAKPSDYLVSSRDDSLHYAEVKSTTHATTFAFKCIRDAQSAAALQEARRGDRAYIFYIFSYATGCWYIMDCLQYETVLASGRKSVKFEELTPWVK
jgi:hypothetical protein